MHDVRWWKHSLWWKQGEQEGAMATVASDWMLALDPVRFAAAAGFVLDEASRIPDAFYGAVLPFLAVSDGALALLSTPFGKRGFFYDSYRQQKEWLYQEVPAEQCPRISRAFLAEQRKKMSELLYAQEYECQFNDSVRGAFRSADIDAAVKDYPVWDLGQYHVAPSDAAAQEEETDGGSRWNLSQYATRS